MFMIPTLSGCKFEDITGAAQPKQPMFYQVCRRENRGEAKEGEWGGWMVGGVSLFLGRYIVVSSYITNGLV